MISIQHTASYDPRIMAQAVDQHFALLGLDSLIRPGMGITLKPNLLMKRQPQAGTTTHPALVEAVIGHLQQLGVQQITIADSPGGLYNQQALAGIYQTCGMAAVAQRTGTILNFDLGCQVVKQPAGQVCKSFEIINPVAQADLVISLCKLKTHAMTGLSGAVKNLFGCIPGLQKPELHWRFPQGEIFCNMLVDLCETVKPAITFVDGVVAMEGNGPSGGTLRQTGLTFCSTNPYELDLLLAKTIHRPAEQVLTILQAARRGLSGLSTGGLTLLGDDPQVFTDFQQPQSARVDFLSQLPKSLRPLAQPLLSRFFTSGPVVLEAQCVGCGRCAESCPAHIIQLREQKAVINDSRCIRCYCCQEMCPVGAITIKRSRIFR